MGPAIRTEAFPDCVICAIAGERLYKGLVDNYCGVEGEFSMSRCPRCGLLWLDPRPAAGDIDKCYGVNYFTHEAVFDYKRGRLAPLKDAVRTAVLCGNYGYRHLHKRHILCRLGRLFSKVPLLRRKAIYGLDPFFPFFKSGGLIVDIGCGNGEYLKMMRQIGWDVLGIEPDRIAADVAKKEAIPVFEGMLAEAKLPDSSADQITMRHAMEHLSDPRGSISECFRILKKGGRLVIRTPNAASLGHKIFKRNYRNLEVPRHLFIFSPESMRLIFEKSPFKEFRIRTLADNAQGTYNHSVLISRRGGLIDMNDRTPQRGNFWFALKESFLCYSGKECGEEIEVTALK